MWLASIARRNTFGKIIPTGKWPELERHRAEVLLGQALAGVGDESREVAFRMNVTLCRHRGLTGREEASLSADFRAFKATDSAGGSVELLWAKGVSGAAIGPCEQPGREYAFGGGAARDPDLWLPVECGYCEPCKARRACRAADVLV